METLRKLIFLGILINLITLNSCESDDLYQNFINEQQKALEEIQEKLIEKAEENMEVPVKNRRDLAASENEYEDGGDEDDGENEQDEHFRLLFNHMRAYRDKNGLISGGGSGENKIDDFQVSVEKLCDKKALM